MNTGSVNTPALTAGDLQDEHIVSVVMGGESLGLWRGDVGVDLHGMPKVLGQSCGQFADRRPGPVQSLKHDRRSVSEQTHDGIVLHLVRDRRARAAGPGEPRPGRTRPSFASRMKGVRNPRWLNSSSAACREKTSVTDPGGLRLSTATVCAPRSLGRRLLPVPSRAARGARGLCSEMTCSGSAE